jgi:anti-sigma B factor antagonist
MRRDQANAGAGRDAVVFPLRGRLDNDSSDEIEQRLLEVIDSGARLLILDLSELRYISSVGLRALLVVARRVGGAGGVLTLCAPDDRVMSILTISGFVSFLDIQPDLETAKRRMGVR